MADVFIFHQFEILIIIYFGMHISFIILQVLTIMGVPLPRSHIGPCFKCFLSYFHQPIITTSHFCLLTLSWLGYLTKYYVLLVGQMENSLTWLDLERVSLFYMLFCVQVLLAVAHLSVCTCTAITESWPCILSLRHKC